MKMKYATFCKVEYYCDGIEHTETCLLYATDFADAAHQLEEYYGDCLSVIRHIELFDSSMITIENGEAANVVYDEMRGVV